MFETVAIDDPGDDLSGAVVDALRSTAAVRAAADAVELQALATLVQVRRGQARLEAARRAEVRRRERPGTGRRPVVVDIETVDRCTAQEVSVALWLSPVAARARMELALELVADRPATFEALRTGTIDLVRARRILDAVRPLTRTSDPGASGPSTDDAGGDDPAVTGETVDVASLVEAEALYPGSVPALADLRPGRGAAESTPAQLTARLARLVLRASPDEATDRTADADSRRACTLRVLPDGMALLSVTGRLELLGAAFARIDATARHRLRAAAGEEPSAASRDELGQGTASCDTAPPGPVVGHDAARTLDQTRVDVLLAALLDDDPGARASGSTRDATGPAGSIPTGGTASRGAHVPSRGTTGGLLTSGGLTRVGGVQVTLALVAPAETVLAGGDAPGELLGLGPVAAPLVRALAADAAWQRWVSHPVTGVVTGTSTRTYRPSAAVADLVRARDARCRFPTCRRRARACDLDHVVRFPDGGTEACNLLCLCRTHHLAKHRGRFRVSLAADGTATWTTPSGRSVTDPPPTWGAQAPPRSGAAAPEEGTDRAGPAPPEMPPF